MATVQRCVLVLGVQSICMARRAKRSELNSGLKGYVGIGYQNSFPTLTTLLCSPLLLQKIVHEGPLNPDKLKVSAASTAKESNAWHQQDL